MDIRIRDYSESDARMLTEIFYRAVDALAGRCYSKAEVRAWAPLPVPYEAWRTQLDQDRPWVAEIRRRPVGFMSLTPDGLIRLAYVDPAYQRLGVAGKLYAVLEHEALSRGMDSLIVEASHAAKPLFYRLGYAVMKRNLTQRQGCDLVNWSMRKSISTQRTQSETDFDIDGGRFLTGG